ncbi:MAG: (Fe-S)-binding protein [Myxococcales bacterium]|nr:(Fe-S)-binding protein [Myxococcales bacterium]
MNPVAMTIVLVVLTGIFAWSAIRRFKLAALGASEPRFSIEGDALGKRVRDTLIYAFGQRKMPYYRGAGIAHILVFSGFMVLLFNSLMLWGRGYDPSFDFFGILAHDNPVGALYAFLKDVFSVLVIFGASTFVYYRVINVQKRMTLSGEGLVILGIIITMMMADQLYVGASRALEAALVGEPAAFTLIEPAGSLWGVMLDGTPVETLTVLQHVGFWWHSSFVLIFLNILPYSKHFHIITAIPNVFARNPRPEKLPNIEDIEGKVEREEPIGFVKITDLSWKDTLDLYTCTECGRCSDNCPAYTTDKKLSPKHLTIALRDHLYACEPELFAMKPKTAGEGEGESEIEEEDTEQSAGEPEELHHGDPPKGAYFQSSKIVDLVPNVIHPDVIWACTSCRACEEQCPVMISYVDKIVQIRRDLVMMKNEFPGELMNPFNGLETNGNPWNLSSMDRGDWAEGLDIPTLSDKQDADVLYWVGCAASYDDRAKKIARATAQMLKQAGVDFAILGTEETCTGDPARRAGNEYLFQMMAEQNVETLKGYEVEKKKIITTCPHCLNMLGNEYPDFGGNYEVVHHSTYLAELIDAKKLVPKNRVAGGSAKVAFHDSCYLGRYNGVYDAPRKVLEAIPGVELKEVNYWNRNKGLCCGAGGAQMFMEEQNENRVNIKRTLQLLDTGCETIASGCPFCMTMLTDGLKAQEKEESIAQKDIVELLAESVQGKSEAEADAAE